MKMLVLGAGLQGSACAYDLLHSEGVTQVTLADLKIDRLPPFLAQVRSESSCSSSSTVRITPRSGRS